MYNFPLSFPAYIFFLSHFWGNVCRHVYTRLDYSPKTESAAHRSGAEPRRPLVSHRLWSRMRGSLFFCLAEDVVIVAKSIGNTVYVSCTATPAYNRPDGTYETVRIEASLAMCNSGYKYFSTEIVEQSIGSIASVDLSRQVAQGDRTSVWGC